MTNTLNNISPKELTRRQLELINRRMLHYPLPIAEKDYFLALAIRVVANSSLSDKLIFKGGTALHHCYLPQKRFSEDLDFTSLDSQISLDEIVSVLEESGIFRANKVYQSDFTIKIERLQYQGLLGQPGNIKFEVDRHQNVVLSGNQVEYKNVWKVTAAPLVMDVREICAEKIRAVSQRARYRDFYDLYFLINELGVDLDAALALLSKKEIRTSVISANIGKNWAVAKKQKNRDLGSIYCSDEISDQHMDMFVENLQQNPFEIQ